jgi:hypothetical protein
MQSARAKDRDAIEPADEGHHNAEFDFSFENHDPYIGMTYCRSMTNFDIGPSPVG